MTGYQQESLDLEQMFGAVLGNLRRNRQKLNAADDFNHDHGNNMVDTFSRITRAMRQTRGALPSDRLEHAAGTLRASGSGSAQVYSQGLSQASRDFQSKQVTPGNAMILIQDLLGGGKPAPAQQGTGGLSEVLGTLLGGESAPAQQQAQGTGGLGDLLGAMLGGGQSAPGQQQQGQGLDTGDLLRAGMAFMAARARGAGTLEALVSAVVAGSAMGSGYREQSSSLVVSSLLSVLQGMAGGR